MGKMMLRENAVAAAARAVAVALVVTAFAGCAIDRGYAVKGTVRCAPEDCAQGTRVLAGAEVDVVFGHDPGPPLESTRTDQNGEFGHVGLLPQKLIEEIVLECRYSGYLPVRIPLFVKGKANFPACVPERLRLCFVVDIELHKALPKQ